MLRETSKELYIDKISTIKSSNLESGDTVIFRSNRLGDDYEMWLDGTVLSANEEYVDICYLFGYRSDNDRVSVEDVFFKVDESADWFYPERINYNGNFVMVE